MHAYYYFFQPVYGSSLSEPVANGKKALSRGSTLSPDGQILPPIICGRLTSPYTLLVPHARPCFPKWVDEKRGRLTGPGVKIASKTEEN
jgi:hypothetical protein